MRRLLFTLVLLFSFITPSFAALSAGTVYELNASATASNVNGGGFNTQNANFPTDLTATSGTGTAAVLSSATYTFVTTPVTDVNAWVFIRSGTNWNTSGAGAAGGGCFWQIASVSAGAATVNSGVGQGICLSAGTAVNREELWVTNTVAGVSFSTDTPSGGTYGVDYSQGTAAILASTGLGSTAAAPTTLTSTTEFRASFVGNLVHITTTGTGAFCVIGWYELTAFTSTSAMTTDRTTNTGTDCVAGTGKVGGAMSMNSTLDDDLFEAGIAGNVFWMKNGAFTWGETVSIAAAGGTQNPIVVAGYATTRGDRPTGTTRPSITKAIGPATSWTLAANWSLSGLIISNSSSATAALLVLGSGDILRNTKVTNKSTTANLNAISASTFNFFDSVELISYRGRALSLPSGAAIVNSYIHDSDIGIRNTANMNTTIINTIIASNVTAAIDIAAAITSYVHFQNLTLYGAENKKGTGILLTIPGSTNVRLMNSIIYGFTTGVNHGDITSISYDDYNDYFNNTTDVTNWTKGKHDLATTPAFTSVAQLTGTTATTSGSVLTQSGGDFSTVVDGQDYLYLVSGTGITAGIYGITSHTGTTLTLDIAPGTDATADKVWQITTGRNWGVGVNMKNAGFPGAFSGSTTTGYMDIGAVQRIPSGQRATGHVQ